MNGTKDRNRRRSSKANYRRPGWLALTSAVFPAVVLAAEIIGTSGPDVLEGTPQDDTINGRGGADTMMGLPGNDSYIVGQAGDEVLEAVGDGTDTIRSTVSYTLPINVENMTLNGSAAINATGNGLANRLTGNTGDNILNGRAGADRMFGRSGDDTYVVDAGGDVVTEAVDEGIDTVNSFVTHTLRVNVEKLFLRGTEAINGTGNERANGMTGNAADNVLRGMEGNDSMNGAAGNDRLVGGPGNDRLTGGSGEDAYQFDEALDPLTNVDLINDFNPAEDELRLIGETFPALTTAGTLAASAFRLGTAAADANDRILYDPATGFLRYDADGTGPTAAVRFARLLTAPAATNADVVVVNPVVVAVDYDSEIQPIFTNRCIACHAGGAAPQGLHLDEGNSHDELVNVASNEVPSLQRVEPGDPDNSYLVQKVEGTAAVGGRMPLGQAPLTAEQIALMRRWISEGADP
jgi:Ca2+-binding RTX toxin-like protein